MVYHSLMQAVIQFPGYFYYYSNLYGKFFSAKIFLSCHVSYFIENDNQCANCQCITDNNKKHVCKEIQILMSNCELPSVH